MVASQLGVTPAQVDKGSKTQFVDEFLNPGTDGGEPRSALLWYFQDGNVTMEAGDETALKATGKCCYVVRLCDASKEVPTKDLEDNLNFGTISGAGGGPMKTLMMIVNELYKPLIKKKAFNFPKKMTAEDIELLSASTESFTVTLEKSLESLDLAMTLPKPEKKVDTKPAAIQAAAADAATVLEYEATVTEWIATTETLLNEAEQLTDTDDVGPRTELGFWRQRATKLNSICDDLRSSEAQVVIMVLQASKSRKLKTWKVNNNQITDALNEAKDIVKYLSTLD
jgi:dynein heavy chain